MRNFALLVLAVVLGWSASSSASSYASTVLSDNPVAYWRMNDTGSVIVDEVSGRTGSLSSGNTTGVPGAIAGESDTAISSGPGGGTISIAYAPEINSQTFTIELWAKFGSNCTDGVGNGNHCAVAAAPKPSPYQGFDVGPIDTLPQMTHSMYLNAEGPNSQYGVTGPLVVLNQWYHLAGSYDGSILSFYVDGALVASRTARFTPDQSRPFQLFGSSNKAMENGTIDEIAYYNYALAADRVETHYLTGIGAIPEPNTALLLGVGLAGLGMKRRARRGC